MHVTMIIDEAFELSDVKAFALSAVLRAFAMLACAELFRTGNESRRPLSLAEQCRTSCQHYHRTTAFLSDVRLALRALSSCESRLRLPCVQPSRLVETLNSTCRQLVSAYCGRA